MLRHKFPSALFKLFPLQPVFLLLGCIQVGTLSRELTCRTKGFTRPDLPAGSRVVPAGTVTLSVTTLHVARLQHVSSYDSSQITVQLFCLNHGWPIPVYAFAHSCSIQHVLKHIIFWRIFWYSMETVTLAIPTWTSFASDICMTNCPNKNVFRHSKCKTCHP